MTCTLEYPVCVVKGDIWDMAINWKDSEGNTDLTGVYVDVRVSNDEGDQSIYYLTRGDGLIVDDQAGLIRISKQVEEDPGNYKWSLKIGTRTRIIDTFKVTAELPTS
ncbi:MAG: hypothetical protein ACIAQF_11110 [Phycisphaerales bacterium JB065]